MPITLQLGSYIYTISVLPGNHGGWLFISRDGMVIYEQAGYKNDDQAFEDGRNIAQADYSRLGKDNT